jgi:hypothetical protein
MTFCFAFDALQAAIAAARCSSHAFSFCFRFFRKVSGTSIAEAPRTVVGAMGSS